MIKIEMTKELTNSYRPEGWSLTDEPYRAYRSKNQISSTTLNLGNNFDEFKPSKIIKTKKGTILLINCSESEDEKIMLLTLRGGFRSGFELIYSGVEVILAGKYSDKHCCPVQDLVIKFRNNDSKLIMKTGRRSYMTYDKITVITWDKIFQDDGFPVEEFIPDNGEIINGCFFNKNFSRDEIELIRDTAERLSKLGLGISIETFCRDGKVSPYLRMFKNSKQINYFQFNKGDNFEKVSETLIFRMEFNEELKKIDKITNLC